MNKIIIPIALLFVTFLIGCGGAKQTPQEGDHQSANAKMDKKQKIVEFTELQTNPFSHYFETQGVVETNLNTTVSPETQGVIRKVYVRTGDHVQKGQTLATIDTEILQKNIQELENSLNLAATVFNKQKRLWEQKIGSEMQYLEAKNSKESLELKLSTLKSQLAKANVAAPFSGVVDEVFVKEGQMANPALPLVRIVNLNNLYIKAEISEDHITHVKKGDEAIITFPSQTIEQKASISRVGSYIDPNNRTFLVEVDIKDNGKGIFKPNLIAIVKIKDYGNDSAIVVPSSVVQQDATMQNFVYVANKQGGDMIAQKIVVKTGLTFDGKTEVLNGLKQGDILITAGARSLSNMEGIQLADKN